MFAPPKPTTFALFVNDNFTLADSLQLNIGLRYEYRDYNYRKIIDPLFPGKTFNRSFNNEIKEDGLTDTKSYSFMLPKLNINYRLFNNLSFSLRYSGNVQSHNYNELFQGFFHQGYLLASGRWNGNDPFLSGDLKPIETSIIEFSSDYNPADNINLHFNYFYKQIKNQSSLDYQQVDQNSGFGKYVIQTGESNSFVNGADLLLIFFDKRFEIFTSLSYQNARGSFLTSHDNTYGDFIYTSAPTTSNNEFNLKAFINYNFLDLKKFSSLFENMNTSLMITFNNGHPYTLIENYSRTESDIRDMKPIGEINGLTTPSITQIDFKLQKDISLFDKMNIGIYLMVINLLDSRNVYDVFRSSGSSDYDAHITNPELHYIYVQSYGEKYPDLYKMNLEYNPRDGQQYFYGPPRQIYLGVKLSY